MEGADWNERWEDAGTHGTSTQESGKHDLAGFFLFSSINVSHGMAPVNQFPVMIVNEREQERLVIVKYLDSYW